VIVENQNESFWYCYVTSTPDFRYESVHSLKEDWINSKFILKITMKIFSYPFETMCFKDIILVLCLTTTIEVNRVTKLSQSTANKMRCFSIYLFLQDALHVSDGFFCPSSGAQNCTYSVRYLSDQYLTLYVQFWAPDDGRKPPPETCTASYRNK